MEFIENTDRFNVSCIFQEVFLYNLKRKFIPNLNLRSGLIKFNK